jgi:hypothetical protein
MHEEVPPLPHAPHAMAPLNSGSTLILWVFIYRISVNGQVFVKKMRCFFFWEV